MSLTRGNGTSTGYAYDPASRLKTLSQDLGGSASDLTLGFTHNPAGQIATATRSNDLYAFAPAAGTRTETPNALNQLASVNGAARTHDARGNLTAEGSRTFAYSSENMLTGASGGVTLAYDPLLRLHQVSGAGVTKFGYDGLDLIAEYDGSNQLLRRHVHGPGADEPLVTYEGSGTTNRRFLHADERGSIVASSDNAGAAVATNRYDEYGVPAPTNSGRFQYTGQAWLPELGLYYYKARMYDPDRARFLQADRIGYGDGMNMYAYVGGDPVNWVDPSGTTSIIVTAPISTAAVLGAGGIAGTGSAYSMNSPIRQNEPQALAAKVDKADRASDTVDDTLCTTPGADPTSCTPVITAQLWPSKKDILRQNPQIRKNFRGTIVGLTGGALTSREIDIVEQRLINEITMSEALQFRNVKPPAGKAPLVITRGQKQTIERLLRNLGGDHIENKANAAYKEAIKNGRIRIK